MRNQAQLRLKLEMLPQVRNAAWKDFDSESTAADHVIKVLNTWLHQAVVTASLCKAEAILLRA